MLYLYPYFRQIVLVHHVQIWQPLFLYFMNIPSIKLSKKTYIPKIMAKWFTKSLDYIYFYIYFCIPLLWQNKV